MTLIVETGTGVAGAESYASVATASTYWAARGHTASATAWGTAITANREGALREATGFLDAIYGPFYRGQRRGLVQGLLWPRSNALDEARMPLPDLPGEIVAATCELAARALSARLMPDADIDGAIKRKRVKAGPVESEMEYAGTTSVRRFGYVAQMLAPILNGAQPGASTGWAWR
jgi:hypothetical protein